MSHLLERAYSQITQLPGPEQDAIAAIIFDALEDEEKWAEQFAGSQDALATLAAEALAEHKGAR